MNAAGLPELLEAARRPAARPLAARLLPGARAAEGIPRLERELLRASHGAPGDVALAARELLDAGGKRVRPLLVLLAARAASGGKRPRGRVSLALAAELVHSATLLHDDVIDDGLTRRGLPAPRVLYGNSVSVLAGDWLLTAAVDLALRSRTPEGPAALVATLRKLVEGEALQLKLRGDASFTPSDALKVARLKTGALFAFCGEAGALVARAAPAVREGLRAFGERCGTAFQVADDLLDFEADPRELGKSVIADVTEGKASLPVAIALEREPALRDELRAMLEAHGQGEDTGGRARELAARMVKTGALASARRVAEQERDRAMEALAVLPHTPPAELLRGVGAALLDRGS